MSSSKWSRHHLEALREIAWRVWDPLGLLMCCPVDEYDGYLLQLAGLLMQGASVSSCARRLEAIEATTMGLDFSATTRKRTIRMVAEARRYLSAANLIPSSVGPESERSIRPVS